MPTVPHRKPADGAQLLLKLADREGVNRHVPAVVRARRKLVDDHIVIHHEHFDAQDSDQVERLRDLDCDFGGTRINARADIRREGGHILDVTTFPANISPRVDSRAAEVAIEIAQALDLIGVLCIEMFVVNDDVIVNELAPRPHNSGHMTIDAFTISQFEKQLRAVCGLPMRNGWHLSEGIAMANLLGDVWTNGEPNWPEALK